MAAVTGTLIDTTVDPPEVRRLASGEFYDYNIGGTGQTTWSQGDILYASAANVLSRLGIGSAGQFLGISGSVPAWQTVTIDHQQTGSLTNANASAAVIGTPVYLNNTASTFDFAKADAYSTAKVFGVVGDTSIAHNATGNIITSGTITFASTAQVDAVCGTTGGFTGSGGIFYLSDTSAGILTSTKTSTAGHHLVPVLRVISNLKAQVLDPFVAYGL